MVRTDPAALAAGPYRTAASLLARVAIYAWQRPSVDLPGTATAALADLPRRALVLDAGCGPGHYLRAVGAARPDLRRLAVDISTGMLRAIDDRQVLRAAGSADALPLPRHTADAALAMHMLYHLADPHAGLIELRRIVRPGGLLIASTNDDDIAEGLWDLFHTAGLEHAPISARWPLRSAGAAVHAAGFDDVNTQLFDYVLDIPTAQPVLNYLDSCRSGFPQVPDDRWADIRHTLADHLATQIQRHGTLRRAGRVGLITAR